VKRPGCRKIGALRKKQTLSRAEIGGSPISSTRVDDATRPEDDNDRIGGTEDPVLALIAEEERIRNCAVDLEDRADDLFFALPEAERTSWHEWRSDGWPEKWGSCNCTASPSRSMKKLINSSTGLERPSPSLSPERSPCSSMMTKC
jgi:hypothetical protein